MGREVRDADDHPIAYRAAPSHTHTTKNYLTQNVNSAEVEGPRTNYDQTRHGPSKVKVKGPHQSKP